MTLGPSDRLSICVCVFLRRSRLTGASVIAGLVFSIDSKQCEVALAVIDEYDGPHRLV